MHRKLPPARIAWSAVAILLPLISGCGRSTGLEKVVVEGSVKMDDRPIENGEIRFYPIEGTPGSVAGAPIKDGRYTAKGRGGVPVGKHRVEILGFQSSTQPLEGDLAFEGGPAEQYVPPKFNSRSELTAVIDAAHATQDFNLSSEEGNDE